MDTNFFSFDTKPVSLLPQVGKCLFLVSVGILFCIISQRHKLLAKMPSVTLLQNHQKMVWDRFYVYRNVNPFFFFSSSILQKSSLKAHCGAYARGYISILQR